MATHICTQQARIAVLESHIEYIKEAVTRIDNKVEDLSSFKFKLMGAATVVAGIISFVVATMAG